MKYTEEMSLQWKKAWKFQIERVLTDSCTLEILDVDLMYSLGKEHYRKWNQRKVGLLISRFLLLQMDFVANNQLERKSSNKDKKQDSERSTMKKLSRRTGSSDSNISVSSAEGSSCTSVSKLRKYAAYTNTEKFSLFSRLNTN